MGRRVVVTGMGAITPIGLNIEFRLGKLALRQLQNSMRRNISAA